MIRRIGLISAVPLLVAFGHTLLDPRGASQCSCGLEPSAEFNYTGPQSDTIEREASVIAISQGQTGKTIRIEASFPNKEGLPQGAYYRTSDFGKTWVKEGAQVNELLEFSLPPVRYRLPLTGDALEKSLDDGNHWRKALLQINSPPASDASRDPRDPNQSRRRVELAAIQPTNPNTLYGCLSVLTETTKSTILSQQFTSLTGIYVSTDGGDHWSLFRDDFSRRSYEEPCVLGINPANPQIMLLHGRSGVIITHDGGKSWAPVGNQLELEKPAPLKGYKEASDRLRSKGIVPPKQWPYDWTYLVVKSIVFEPRSESVVYLVTNKGLYKTDDGGRTWCLMHTGFGMLFGVGSVFIDEAEPNRIFVGVDTKILFSPDRGCHFETFLDTKNL